MPLYQVGDFFRHTNGELYLLVNTGDCPMLVGLQSGNRWSDEHSEYPFYANFSVEDEEEWRLVTSEQPGSFTKVNVEIEGIKIKPSWEL